MRRRLPVRLVIVTLASLAVIESGCRSVEPRLQRGGDEEGPAIPRFSRKGVPDSVILRPQTEGGFGAGPLQ